MTGARLRRLATCALLGAILVVAGCDAVRPAPSLVAERPPMELPVPRVPRTPDGPEAPDFAEVFAPVPRTVLPGTELCGVREEEPCLVSAGTHHSTIFATDVVLKLRGSGWTNIANAFDALAFEDGTRAFTIVSQAPKVWLSAPRPTRQLTPESSWENLVERGEARGFSVGPLVEAGDIDGRPVKRFDVVNDGVEPQWILSTEGWRLGCWCGGGFYEVPVGSSARLLYLEVEGDGVVIVLEAPTDEFDTFLAEMRPVVRSIDFIEGATAG